MSLPYLTNHIVKVPGTTVTAYLAEWTSEERKGEWTYSLWDEDSADMYNACIGNDTMDLSGFHNVTPDQVARMAFLLEVEYQS